MGRPLPSRPELYVAILGSTRAHYEPSALGLGGHPIEIRLTNVSPRSVDVGPLHAAFTATRDGVAFPCQEHVSRSVHPHEPSWLAPGQSFDFERNLDCTLPLPGAYDVRVFVRLGGGGESIESEAGQFRLDLEGGPRAPRPYPPIEGLFVAMTGASTPTSMTPEAWAQGDYRVLIAVINGGRRAIAMGPARIAFATYRQGAKYPCAGEAEALDFGERLDPGNMHVASAPVACAPAQEGHYEIVGRFTLENGSELEVGRIALEVTRYPTRFTPDLWAPWDTYPGGLRQR